MKSFMNLPPEAISVLCHGGQDVFLTPTTAIALSRCFLRKNQNAVPIAKAVSTGNVILNVLNTFSLTNHLKLAGSKSGS